ncbi:RNA-binding S4 domain-containing protein [Salipaludibacillus sp. LMS25]|jgi:ribosomal 50S subunit-recycling heat shock protein|uniref:RNA-binding S4 domain-containing protein n=1 Tax=Salipaludibacillus sp. LMS25 TaxID=2924031 RepID=UPI0020D1C653|nr:RNA-binding S4 domain-containing protein [Salipaludibacillus sp. LMS25]UTR16659.1 RNA-binding S4 domain-containing protein [Salipaludibacillus sp. LMS25]
MRLDKYLKVSRLIKRRTMAKEVASQGRVKINGQPAKPGTEVKPGDELEVLFGQKHMTIRIDRVEESVKKEEAATFYSILKEERIDND